MRASTLSARRLLPWLPPIALMVLIFVLSSQSGLRVSEDVAVERPIRFSGHLLAFGTLAGLLLVALCWGRRPRARDAVVAFGITLVYALTDELHQSLVPDRNGRIDDVVTDALGAVIGVAVAWVLLVTLARGLLDRLQDGAADLHAERQDP